MLHWLLHGVGLLPDYRPVFHSIAQIQGFMMCFAVGFLLTAIPRLTGTPPPATWQILVGVAGTTGTVVCAWLQWFGASQVFWLAVVLALAVFVVQRFRRRTASRRPPSSFVWIPLSFAIGVAGSLLIATYGVLGDDYYRLHELGRLLLLQGMFCGLVVGAGGMVLPLLTRGQGRPDEDRPDGAARFGHLLAALLLVGSFWWEQEVSLVGGLSLRAALLAWLMIGVAGIWRRPTVPGWHRRLVWLSAWMLPAGYVLAAALPAHKKVGLHVVFIGGFAMMALSVGLHVVLAHGGYEKLVRGRPWQVPLYGGALLAALVLRGLMDLDAPRFFVWLTAASGCFLAAMLLWCGLVIPRVFSDA